MKKNETRRPILYKGEAYKHPISKRGGPLPPPPITFEEARLNILRNIDDTVTSIKNIPKGQKLPDEQIICLRFSSKYTAKSYYPSSLFDSDINFTEVGTRGWNINNEDQNADQTGKLIFVRTNISGLNDFKRKLENTNENSKKAFCIDIRRLGELNLLSADEQIVGIDREWKGGMIEAVLHPFSENENLAIEHFRKKLINAGVQDETIKIRQYNGGVTFVSLKGDRNTIKELSGYNPLRTVHPLEFRDFPTITKGMLKTGGPIPPKFKGKSKIVMGVIDGGAHEKHPIIGNYVEIVHSVLGSSSVGGLDHGSQVTGAALFGPLNKYKDTDELPEPGISVRNFRVISTTNTKSKDLYEIIDAIEEIIPNNPDIQVYNLSLGPRGPIQDDLINRFTFACDLLSKKYNVLFCVAVGNDGHVSGYDRIQSPSDMVNGLAIGAYSEVGGKFERAPYSCKGPGREGNKLKPDLSAFGGCSQNPFHLVSLTANTRIYDIGTSFASPLAASAVAKVIGNSNGLISPLVARALMVHSSVKDKKSLHNIEMGYGRIPENLNDIVNCHEKSFTLIYEDSIRPGSWGEYKIPWLNEITEGSVSIDYTVAMLANIDPQSPDDYTTAGIEVIFYPNSRVYNFTKDGKVLARHLDNDVLEISDLIEDGYKQSSFPKSDSGKSPFVSELGLKKDLKWDSLDHRQKRKNAVRVFEPCFHIHALARSGKRAEKDKVKFALILTVTAPKAKIDLYSKIIAQYRSLVPLKMEIHNIVNINTSKN